MLKNRLNNLEELLENPKMRIREEIAALSIEICGEVAENVRYGFQRVIAINGHHLRDVIFKK